MKKSTVIAILIGGAIAATQSASAGFVSNDLYFGLANPSGGGSEDDIYNLGTASSIVGISSITTFNISGFSSGLLGTNAPATESSIVAGVVGGSQGTPDVYYTILRSSLGTPGVAGSTTPDPLDNIEGAVSALTGLNAPTAGNGVTDAGKSWDGQVANQLVNNSFAANGKNPDSTINLGGILYEDLYYQNQDSTTPTYLGYFTLDLTEGIGSPDLTFTPEAVPEPASYALVSASGLLLLAFRRRLLNKNS